MSARVLITAALAALTIGAALSTASATEHAVAQQPWDPGCWGPFAWGANGCDWSPTSGPSSSGPWDPSVTGPGQFNRAGTGSGSTS
ncbi:MAG: hypothetical protein PGN37_25380 [Mycobacterium kyogaense]|uniref:hypothetical protein n=1 Tax=Mycobacterium kyogaense TaxID=2212479 RepID=UPI002FFB7827